jgi:PPOX class probable F420-dependent enzyme
MFITVGQTGAGGEELRLSEQNSRLLFETVPVARLATIRPDGQPHIVPVTFAVDGDRIYTAVDAKPKSSRDLQRLRNIAAEPRVAMLADHYEPDWARLWWIRADGHAAILTEPSELAGPLSLLAARYAQYRASPPPGPVIQILATRWTGWAAEERPGPVVPEWFHDGVA